jgi:hypothetical protein
VVGITLTGSWLIALTATPLAPDPGARRSVLRHGQLYDMANAIAFGLMFGMVLALGAVPVLHAILFGIHPPPPEQDRPRPSG